MQDEEWQRFYDHAVLTAEFLAQEEFQKHYKPGLFDHNDLMLLFKKLLIFAVINETEVFVPALVRRLTREELDEHRRSYGSASPLVLTFPRFGGPLLGVFCATVVDLLSPENVHPRPWMLVMDNNDGITPVCLYRNCVRPGHPGSITLIDLFEQIEVHVSEAASKAGNTEVIKNAVIQSIHKATLALHYNYDKPELAFGCPCGTRPGFHLAKVGENSIWICSKNKEKFGALTPQQKAWLEGDHR